MSSNIKNNYNRIHAVATCFIHIKFIIISLFGGPGMFIHFPIVLNLVLFSLSALYALFLQQTNNNDIMIYLNTDANYA